MAPPTMFNIFRSSHRREGSTPSSPQSSTSRPFIHHSSSQAALSSPLPERPPNESPISLAPPVLPPIPRVASKHEDDLFHFSSRPTSRDHEPLEDAHFLSDRSHTRRISDQSRSPPSAWRPSYSLGLNFDPPSLPSIPRASANRDPTRPPVTPPNPTSRPSDPTFTIEPPPATAPSPDDSPASAAPVASKISRTYSSLADFGRFDFRRGSKLSTEASGSSKSPSTNSRTQSHEPSQALPNPQHGTSPSSSITSFQKAPSQTNLTIDTTAAGNSRSGPSVAQPNSAPMPRLTKARNLLNPVSLLMRRRTSQVDEADIPTAPQRMFEVPALEVPQDYDPRIRGKRVHDFDDDSRKPRRNLSTNDMMGMARASHENRPRRSSVSATSGVAPDAVGFQGTEKEHTPVFVENFDDDNDEQAAPEQVAKAVQRESRANQDFLARASKQFNFDATDFGKPLPAPYEALDAPSTPPLRSASATPPTAVKRSCEVPIADRPVVELDPSAARTESTPSPANPARTSRNTDVSSLRVSLDQSTARSSVSNDTGSTTPPQQTPPRDQSRRSATLEAPFQPTTPLKHLSSNASRVSRFSFQFNSERSIEQERALEEKHKAKYDAKSSKHVSLADSRFEELEDEDFDYDGMEDGGAYEEDIPELGGYDGDETFNNGLASTTLGNLAPLPQPGLPTAPSSQYTTRSPTEMEPSEPPSATEPAAPSDARYPPARTMTRSTVISDDMYYDDGVIGPQVQPGASDTEFVDHTRGEYSSHTERRLEWHAQGIGSRAADQQGAQASRQPTQKSYEEALEESTLRHSTSLNAYHSALAGAATKAAKDGRFSRGQSVNTASSRYSNPLDDFADGLSPDADDTVFDMQQDQSFDDVEEEEDPMIAAANAEVLASEDAEFYGNEFGFYGTSAVSKDGQMYHGGYFGQPEMLRAALSLRATEPNLTPITERSEYSTRNSFIGSTPWGPSQSASQANLGLKELAASLGVDDNDMTLSQLMRLRRAAFEGNGSNPRSVQGSSGSNDSSPTSQQNTSSPLAFKHQSSSLLSLQDIRRPSDLELPNVSEAPEVEDFSEDALLADSPISPTVTFGTAQAIALNKQARRQSAEIYAREYQDFVTKSLPAQSQTNGLTTHERHSSSPVTSLPSVAGPSSPPLLASPKSPRSSVTSPLATPLLYQFPAVPSSSSAAVPLPPSDMMEKFAQRPPPDAYRKSWEPSQRASMGGQARDRSSDGSAGSTSVAYVRDVGSDGKEKWYLERRRKRSSGDLIVLSREAVKGGI